MTSPQTTTACEDSSRFGRWLPWMHLRARRMIGPRLEKRISPASLVQHAVLVYCENRARVAAYSSRRVAGWLVGVMRMGILAKLAEANRGPTIVPLEHDPEGREPEAHEQTLRDELHRRLIEAVDQLDERYRQVLVWHRDEGLSHEEIGRRLGITAAYSAVIHHRAIQRLREILTNDDGPAETHA